MIPLQEYENIRFNFLFYDDDSVGMYQLLLMFAASLTLFFPIEKRTAIAITVIVSIICRIVFSFKFAYAEKEDIRNVNRIVLPNPYFLGLIIGIDLFSYGIVVGTALKICLLIASPDFRAQHTIVVDHLLPPKNIEITPIKTGEQQLIRLSGESKNLVAENGAFLNIVEGNLTPYLTLKDMSVLSQLNKSWYGVISKFSPKKLKMYELSSEIKSVGALFKKMKEDCPPDVWKALGIISVLELPCVLDFPTFDELSELTKGETEGIKYKLLTGMEKTKIARSSNLNTILFSCEFTGQFSKFATKEILVIKRTKEVMNSDLKEVIWVSIDLNTNSTSDLRWHTRGYWNSKFNAKVITQLMKGEELEMEGVNDKFKLSLFKESFV